MVTAIPARTTIVPSSFYEDSASNQSRIEGFTIKNGCIYSGQPLSKNYGGGIFIYKSQPTIRGCVFTGNRALRGGAIALESEDPWSPGWLPMIENCTISNNRAVVYAEGGGIWAQGHIDPLIKDCVITENCTTNTGLATCNCSATPLPACVSGQGGGVFWGQGCDPQIVGTALQGASVIEDNAAGEGGGVYIQNMKVVGQDLNIEDPKILRTRVGPDNRARSGGGIYVAGNFGGNDADYPFYIEDCEIIGNHAEDSNGYGGGLFLNAEGTTGGSVLKVTMANVIIGGNTALGYGGGMNLASVTVLEASNLTFMYNTAGTGNGNPGSAINLHFYDAGQYASKISNSILWYDSSPPSQNQIRLEGDSAGHLDIWFSDTQTTVPAGVGSYYNRINQNPLFVYPEGPDTIKGTADDDYRLGSCSPCIDEGDKDRRPTDDLDLDDDDDTAELIPLDLDEESRVIGPNSKLDMGAYEYLFGCPAAYSLSAFPLSGTLDARRPHPSNNNSLAYREGIGNPNPSRRAEDKIAITLSLLSGARVCRASAIDCWELCETGVDTVEPPPPPPTIPANYIASVSERSGSPRGVYDVTLFRAISAGHWTTINYAGNDDPVVYSSLPADANADGASGPSDILALIDHLNGQHPMTIWQCDMDHSGVCGPADILEIINLLNGADTFIAWLGRQRPANTCIGDGLVGGGGGLESKDVDTQEFADWFVNYLTSPGPKDGVEGDDFQTIVKALTQWCVDHFTVDERNALADRLSDPTLDLAGDAGRIAAEEVAAALTQ